LFFSKEDATSSLSYAMLIFGIGLMMRPLGGVFFGRFGDRFGRRKALLLSLFMLAVPSLCTGFLPTYAQIGLASPIFLILLRILQGFPAGGELPGAFCYLYESATVNQRHFISSWGTFGAHFGFFLSTVECILLEHLLTPEQLLTWGWRLSFIVGGILGLCGMFLRYYLHETPLFQKIAQSMQHDKRSLRQILHHIGRPIGWGSLYYVFNSTSYFIISANVPIFIHKFLDLGNKTSVFITGMLILIMTLSLPFFGLLAERYNNRLLLMYTVSGASILLFPLYLSIQYSIFWLLGITTLLIALSCACTSALLPYLLCSLFQTRTRFTGVGLSFNIADAAIGSFVPPLVLFLYHFTGIKASFCLTLLPAGLVSLIAYAYIKKSPKKLHRITGED